MTTPIMAEERGQKVLRPMEPGAMGRLDTNNREWGSAGVGEWGGWWVMMGNDQRRV